MNKFSKKQMETIRKNAALVGNAKETVVLAKEGISWKQWKQDTKKWLPFGDKALLCRADFVFNNHTKIHIGISCNHSLKQIAEWQKYVESVYKKMPKSKFYTLKLLFTQNFEWYRTESMFSEDLIKFKNINAMEDEDIVSYCLLGCIGNVISYHKMDDKDYFVSVFGDKKMSNRFESIFDEETKIKGFSILTKE